MSVTIVPTLPTSTQPTATDSSSSSDASSGQQFADVLSSQLALGDPQPVDAGALLAVDLAVADEVPTDPVSLLATLGLAAAPEAAAVATLELATPTVVTPAASAPADDTSEDAVPADAASLLAALGLVTTPAISAPAAPATSDTRSAAPLGAVSSGAGQGLATEGKISSVKAQAVPTGTALTDDEAAKFAVALESAKQSDTSDSTSPPENGISALSSNASGNTGKIQTQSDSPLSIRTAVRSQSWANDLGQKVVWLATNDKQSAQLTLNPPQMGPIEISLSVDNGSTSVSFTSANAEVRDALETALPKLREMFASAGIELGQTNVSSESFKQPGGNAGQYQSSSRSTADNAILAENSMGSLQVKAFNVQQGNGLINIFA